MSLKDKWKDLVDEVEGIAGSGDDISVEPINLIANSVIELEENKVDKEEGKSLSTEDYTTEEKNKLSALPDNEELDNEILTISTDVEKIKNNVSNAIKGKQSGEVLSINDISPIEHNVDIKIHSKNIYNYDEIVKLENPYGTIERTETGLKVTTTKDSSANSIRMWLPFSLFELGKTYTVSSTLISTTLDVAGTDDLTITADTVFTKFGSASNVDKCTFTVTKEYDYIRILLYKRDAVIGDVYTADNFQIEEGETATNYSGYLDDVSTVVITVNDKEYMPDLDGTIDNVKSSFPTMEITSDTEGVTINCEYNRDLNKVIEELTNAIISLGGNI